MKGIDDLSAVDFVELLEYYEEAIKYIKQLEKALKEIDKVGYKIELSTKYSEKEKEEFICLKCKKKVDIAKKALEGK